MKPIFFKRRRFPPDIIRRAGSLNQDRHRVSRMLYKERHSTALAEWQNLVA